MNRICVLLFFTWCGVSANSQPISQGVLEGPQNILPDGVVDGVVVKDEVPVRSHVDYEYVRLADYAWSKRVFSRIDAREKVNYPLFYPFDEAIIDEFDAPKSDADLLSNKNWIKHQERYSLWTVILMNIMKGNLTIFKVNSEEGLSYYEDGYQLKYPLSFVKDNNLSPFYINKNGYADRVSKFISVGGKKTTWFIEMPGGAGEIPLTKGVNQTFKQWVDSLTDTSNGDLLSGTDDGNGGFLSKFDNLNDIMNDPEVSPKLEAAWKEAADDANLEKSAKATLITSNSISAYNIKEDWFFDKERSMLDKRIIAIAPVGRYKVEVNTDPNFPNELERYKNFILVGRNGELLTYDNNDLVPYEISDKENIEEREMFWLYFPELRSVLVNYYVYNNQSDAQWMSFDDFFWKRMFSAQIYRSSDQFDRNVEDYRYGVDALYEAEKIKETMRTWETDLWNY